jgi:hypothetical protein
MAGTAAYSMAQKHFFATNQMLYTLVLFSQLRPHIFNPNSITATHQIDGASIPERYRRTVTLVNDKFNRSIRLVDD